MNASIVSNGTGGWRVTVCLLPPIAHAYDRAMDRHSGQEEKLFDLLIWRGHILHKHFMAEWEIGFGQTPEEAAENHMTPGYYIFGPSQFGPSQGARGRQSRTPRRVFDVTSATRDILVTVTEELECSLTSTVNLLLRLGSDADAEVAAHQTAYIRRNPHQIMTPINLDPPD